MSLATLGSPAFRSDFLLQKQMSVLKLLVYPPRGEVDRG